MSHLEDQKKLTDNKGWKNIIVNKFKEDISKAKTHVQNIVGGIKATPALIKKTLKKD